MVKLPISDYVANYYKDQGIAFGRDGEGIPDIPGK